MSSCWGCRHTRRRRQPRPATRWDQPLKFATAPDSALLLARSAGGNFVTVWNDGTSCTAQRYDASAAPQGDNFAVGADDGLSCAISAIATDDAGDLIVVWRRQNLDHPVYYDLYLRRYGADGSARSSSFAVQRNVPYPALATPPRDVQPQVGLDARGNPVFAWTDRSTPSHSVIKLRATPDDPFVTLWPLDAGASPGSEVGALYAQMCDTDGVAAGSPFRIDSDAAHRLFDFQSAVDGQRNLLAGWLSYDQTAGFVEQAQLFSDQ